MKSLYKVVISPGLSYECIGDLELGLKKGDQVVVRCDRYLDFATIDKHCPCQQFEDVETFEKQRLQTSKGRHIEGQRTPQIIRLATPEDAIKASDNAEKAFAAHNTARERIHAHNLEMKLIQTHYAFDRKMLLFQFSAEGRVDFRELLRDLSALFHVRVELRQVGVRDEAAVLGGIGSCGRSFCCATFLPSFNSINVKMAKQQGLSLNPQNISGCCGRLKCCLQYEAEFYRQAAAEAKRLSDSAAGAESGTNDDGEGQARPPRRPLPNGGGKPRGGGGNGRGQAPGQPAGGNRGQNNPRPGGGARPPAPNQPQPRPKNGEGEASGPAGGPPPRPLKGVKRPLGALTDPSFEKADDGPGSAPEARGEG